MKITILTVGKIKEKFYREAVGEYAKRLGKYCHLNIIETSDEKTPDKASPGQEEQIKNKEGQRLLTHMNMKENTYIIALAIEGTPLSSEQLARKIERLGVEGSSHIMFVIGGSLGLSENVLQRCHYRLSFSAMTFPHQLMRVILLEQIYRCFRINAGEPYHK